MTPDVGILTTLLTSFGDAFTNGLGFIHGDARWLLGTLIIIDLLIAVLLNLSDGDHMKTLITKILKYGLFIWLVMDYKALANVVLNSFEAIGLKAGGGGITNAMLNDPSEIASYGIWVTEPIFEFIDNLGTIDTIKNLHKIIFTGFTGLIIMLCFFIIGIQIFITYLEFYIVATVALILLPFGVYKHTAFLGEKAIGAVLSFGIKLMVLAFIASVAIPLVKTWSIPVDPTNKEIFCLLLGSLALTFLAWHAPGVASGLLSGHPTLTGGSAAGFALAGGMAAYGMGAAGVAAKNTAVAAAKAAAGGAGQLSGAYSAGGMGGVASLAKDKVSGVAHSVTDGVRNSYTSGKDHGSSVATGGGGGGSASPSSGSGSSPSPRRTAGELAQKLVYVKNSIPPESGGGGSATPNLSRGGE
jgi:type IV secretion system protein TrbL